MDDANTASLMDITGVSGDVARGLLQITNGDVGQACAFYFDNPDVANSFAPAPTASASAASGSAVPPASTSNPSRAPTGRSGGPAAAAGGEDEPIQIESDDDDADFQMGGTPGRFDADIEDDEAAAVNAAARSAQEDEDARYARQLQEEIYGAGGGGAAGGSASGGGLGGGDDEIRAPIARTTETLVGPGSMPYHGMGGFPGIHGDEDDEQDAAAYMAELRRARAQRNARSRNPFAQSVWDAEGGPAAAAADPGLGGDSGGSRQQSSTSRRLAELFRPPFDILTHLSWDDTREEGKDQKKWILVNLQDATDFRCQMLNRDVWKDDDVKSLIQQKFLFLQFDKEDPEAHQYINLYMATQQHNTNNYPHVAVVDPRTGEQLKVWSGDDCPTKGDVFAAELRSFLERYKFEGKNPVATARAPQPRGVVNVDRMTEEEMLQMAMQNSLEAAGGAAADSGSESSSSRRPGVIDPDQMTRTADKGKSKEEEEEEPEAAAAAPASPWTTIASDRPHEEPAQGAPGTTRIQFKHSGGRVIRRFNVSDPVRRLYEWLKSEPIGGDESKKGVEFELKRMPASHDLITDLDKTIEEADLKQSTLAVEFIGDH